MAARIVYARLFHYAWKKTYAYPSYATLAKECGVTRRTAINSVTELVEKGFLKKEHRGRTSNRFYLLMNETVFDSISRSGEKFSPGGEKDSRPEVKKIHPKGEKTSPQSNYTTPSIEGTPRNTVSGVVCSGDLPPEADEYISLKMAFVGSTSGFTSSRGAYQRTLRSRALVGQLDMSDLDDLRAWHQKQKAVRQEAVELRLKDEQRQRDSQQREEKSRETVRRGVEISGKTSEEWACIFDKEGLKPFSLRRQFFGLPWGVARRHFQDIFLGVE